MNLKQALSLFVILWLHISLLNFVFIGYNGLVFLWQESIQWQTLVTHVLLSALAVVCCYLADRLITRYSRK